MTSDSLAPARLQAAAAARIRGRPSIDDAAESGNAGLVLDHIVDDPAAVHATDSGLDYDVALPRGPPSGRTALHLSSRKGHREVCELLISCGAQVNAKDNGYVALCVFFLKITR